VPYCLYRASVPVQMCTSPFCFPLHFSCPVYLYTVSRSFGYSSMHFSTNSSPILLLGLQFLNHKHTLLDIYLISTDMSHTSRILCLERAPVLSALWPEWKQSNYWRNVCAIGKQIALKFPVSRRRSSTKCRRRRRRRHHHHHHYLP